MSPRVLLSACILAGTTQAATFNLSTASISDIHAATDAGALTSEKLLQLYLARIEAYDQKGPKLNTVITLNPKALDEARALDAERKSKGRRSPLHGIPVLVKDNFDTYDMATSGGAFFLEKSVPKSDAYMIAKLREAGAIILAKVNLNEFAAGGDGFSSLGGQTRNPHDPTRGPGGSSGGTGAGLAAWFAPLGLGTDTGGSIRNPCSFNGIPGIKPTNGLLSRAGIIPRVLSFDTGGPMARNVYDVALSLGFMTGLDPADPLTSQSAGLFYQDYTQFLKKDALKGARIGVVRDFLGQDPEVDRIFDRTVAELRAQGAVVVENVKIPAHVLSVKTDLMAAVRATDAREEFAAYLANLQPGFPKTLGEMVVLGEALKEPKGRYLPNLPLYARFKEDNAGPAKSSLAYRSAKVHGMAMVRDAVQGLFEQHQLDAIVYPTWPKPAPVIGDRSSAPTASSMALTNIANITQFPDVIVPAGFTTNKLPVTVSFLGTAYSEPRLLAYAYAYEQATHHQALPTTTPPLAGEVFDY